MQADGDGFGKNIIQGVVATYPLVGISFAILQTRSVSARDSLFVGTEWGTQ